MGFTFYNQQDAADCGPTCLKMIARHYGKVVDSEYIKRKTFANKDGVNLLDLEQAAKHLNFDTLNAQTTLEKLVEHSLVPCILFWNKNHFVVLYAIQVNARGKRSFRIADPSSGKITLDEETFKKFWLPNGIDKGFCLFLEPNEHFSREKIEAEKKVNIWHFLYRNIVVYKSQFLLILILTLISSAFTFALPFVNQEIIDVGIKNNNLEFIKYMLYFQLFFFTSNTLSNVFRAHILLHTSNSINIKIITDFLMKILRLPVLFFETKRTGDILQRIEDNKRVEDFVSRSFISTFFSLVNLIVFISVLVFYHIYIAGIFILGSVLSIGWTLFFLKKRKTIDYKRFIELSDNTDEIFEIVKSMPEIKLNSFEDYKARQWRKIQNKVFHINMSSLKIDQFQLIGADFITQIKNIFITFFSAYAVTQGQMTLGMMLSIGYIIGQLNVPIAQLTNFISTLQTVGISLKRIGEVHNQKNEESDEYAQQRTLSREVWEGKLILNNLSFQYGGTNSPFVLKNVDAIIPLGKVTAIVGASGSGKTTLLKLLLRFYEPTAGFIQIGKRLLSDLSPALFRKSCGVVMQDGVIFSDTILRNIVMDHDCDENDERMIEAAKISRIHDFIAGLPLGYQTKVGNVGIGLSEGQKQRILISRAIYRNPDFLFLDEATSSLDAENERFISERLNEVYKNKTVIIVAHRLSTVRNADHIIVLHNGAIVEQGSHEELIKSRRNYYNLIKNQLELGT